MRRCLSQYIVYIASNDNIIKIISFYFFSFIKHFQNMLIRWIRIKRPRFPHIHQAITPGCQRVLWHNLRQYPRQINTKYREHEGEAILTLLHKGTITWYKSSNICECEGNNIKYCSQNRMCEILDTTKTFRYSVALLEIINKSVWACKWIPYSYYCVVASCTTLNDTVINSQLCFLNLF